EAFEDAAVIADRLANGHLADLGLRGDVAGQQQLGDPRPRTGELLRIIGQRVRWHVEQCSAAHQGTTRAHRARERVVLDAVPRCAATDYAPRRRGPMSNPIEHIYDVDDDDKSGEDTGPDDAHPVHTVGGSDAIEELEGKFLLLGVENFNTVDSNPGMTSYLRL